MAAKGSRFRNRLYFFLFPAAAIVSWFSWRLAPGAATRLDFEWSQSEGFASARIDRPISLSVLKVLASPFDEIVKLQAKRSIAMELQKNGITKARGKLDISTFGPLPIVLGLDHISNKNGAFLQKE
jgi:hypothetical protein